MRNAKSKELIPQTYTFQIENPAQLDVGKKVTHSKLNMAA